jgi:hypothetical protein
MKVNCLWKTCGNFSLSFILFHTKLIFPCMQGKFFMFFFVPYKVNIPMYAGRFKQVLYKEYICWIQVKIHISDQTSLRICNSEGALRFPHRKVHFIVTGFLGA